MEDSRPQPRVHAVTAGREPSALRRADWISGHSISEHHRISGASGGLPSLHVIVGTDATSGGMAALAALPTGGRWQNTQALVTARWQDHPQSVEECVRIAIRGLQAYLKECDLPPE